MTMTNNNRQVEAKVQALRWRLNQINPMIKFPVKAAASHVGKAFSLNAQIKGQHIEAMRKRCLIAALISCLECQVYSAPAPALTYG